MRHILSCCLLFLAACNSSEERTSESDTLSRIEVQTDAAPVAKADTIPVTFTGLYSFGNEVSTFTTCDGAKTYWVNDSLANMRKPYEDAGRFLSYPYESRYAEVKGYLAGPSKLGYASEYDNVLVITEVIKVEAKNFKTECYPYEFIALGNEPFWSLDIIPGEKLIVFKDAGNEKVYTFPYSASKTGNGEFRYETVNGKNEKLVVVFRREKCSDGMSDRTYEYSVQLTIGTRSYTGCGIRRPEV